MHATTTCNANQRGPVLGNQLAWLLCSVGSLIAKRLLLSTSCVAAELFMDRSALIYWSAVGALLTYAQVCAPPLVLAPWSPLPLDKKKKERKEKSFPFQKNNIQMVPALNFENAPDVRRPGAHTVRVREAARRPCAPLRQVQPQHLPHGDDRLPHDLGRAARGARARSRGAGRRTKCTITPGASIKAASLQLRHPRFAARGQSEGVTSLSMHRSHGLNATAMAH